MIFCYHDVYNMVTKTNHMLVLVHANWCPHCLAKNPELRRVWKECETEMPNVIAIEEKRARSKFPSLMKHVSYYPTLLKVHSNGRVTKCKKQLSKKAIEDFNK